ncbi:hypothetical protein Tco_0700684 [Tanacetum coccineum]
MTSKAQQIELDNAQVAPKNHRVIGKCNMRISPGMKPKEPTYQFWATVDKHKASYRFKINNKRFSVNVEVFRDILNICPRIQGQEFDEPLTEKEALSFIHKLGHSREIKYITDVIVDHIHQPWRTFASIINKCLCGKTYYAIALGAEPLKSKKPKTKSESTISSEETPSKKKPTKAKKDVPSNKKPASKTKPTKKKASVEADRGKDEGTGTKPGVPDAPKYLSESENESWGDSDDDESNDDNSDEVTKDDDEDDVESDANDDKEASDSEKTKSDEDENLNLNLNDEEEEDDDVRTPDRFELNDDDKEYDELYKDENVRSKVTKHEEVEKGDAEITDTTHKNEHLSTRIGFATQTALQSYTAEFEKKAQAEKEKYIDIIEKSVKEIIKDEVKSQLPQILPKEISDFATPVIQSTINESLENVVLAKSSSQPQSTYEAATSLTEFELKKILLDKLEKSKSYRAAEQHRDLYDALVKSYQLDKDLFDSYGKSYSLKRGREDKDKDKDPPAGSNQGLKKRKTSKDAEPSRGSKSKESKSSSSKGSKSQSKSSGKSAQAEEPVFETADTEMPQDQGDDMGNTDDQPNVEKVSKNDWFKKPEKPPTPDRD